MHIWHAIQIYHLVDTILYVRKNEPTARIIFMHVYQNVEDIPSELAPNVKILDEAFPSITLDLVFVQGTFRPAVSNLISFIHWSWMWVQLVQAVSKKMDIRRSRMFMSCFGASHPYTLAEYRGLRLIHHWWEHSQVKYPIDMLANGCVLWCKDMCKEVFALTAINNLLLQNSITE